MPQKYDFEMRQQAHDLYVMGGLTFEQVAQVTGVSVSQLKRWSAEELDWAERRGETDPKDWPELRKEFRLSQSSASRQAIVLRALLISNAIGSGGDFKRVLAAAMWEKTQAGKGQAAPAAPPESPQVENLCHQINTPQDAVAALGELVNRKMHALATQPGALNFQTVKDLKQTMALIEELKAKYQPDDKSGLSDEAAAEIRRQFLGVK